MNLNPSNEANQDQNSPPDGEPGNGAPPEKPQRRGSAEQLAEIGKLLRGDADDQGDPDDQDDAGDKGGKPSKFKSLDDVAKALNIDVAALYDLEVPLRSDTKERKKLGELKDYFAGQDDHRLSRLEWEEQRATERADLNRARLEVAELLQAVPKDKLNADVLNAVRKKQDAVLVAERRKTIERIPEWKDDEVRSADLQGMVEHLMDYGFPVETLQSISDHRMLAYMRDNWLRMSRLKAALEKVKPVRTRTPPRSPGHGPAPARTPVRPTAGNSNTATQVAAISKLLRGSRP